MGVPLGSRCCRVLSVPESSRGRYRDRFRMEGVRPRQRWHETPVFMRVLENPVDGYNAASGWAKSMGKGRFPQDFLDFVPISSLFAHFLLFLPVFCPVASGPAAPNASTGRPSMQPEKHLLL